MEKITFFENIGGFFITPNKHTKYVLNDKGRNWKRITVQSLVFSLMSSIFAGFVLMFYMMYPEVFWVPGALHTGRLFLYAAASPLLIVGMFALGFILVFIYSFLIHGSISYWIVLKTLKIDNGTSSISYIRYLSLYSYSLIYTTVFHMITVLWIYFFEKFSYTKIFFPVTDLTLPVIIHLTIMFLLGILKWIWEIRINLGIYGWSKTSKPHIKKSILIFLGVKIALTATIFFIIYLSGNLIAGAQWS